MSDTKITPVILSGGGGTRLWPLSTPKSPKQFLRLFGDNSLFQNTIKRGSDNSKFTPPMIVGSAKHQEITNQQLTEIGVNDATIILEPAARKTAPAIALAALSCSDDSLMLVMPSDHLIGKEDSFSKAIECAKPAAMDGYLITFGITPTKPETGYGYIKCGEELSGFHGAHAVPEFTEKPALNVAQQMLDDGNFLWNAGIFLFRADAYIEALNRHAPDIVTAAKKSLENTDGNLILPDQNAFEASPSDSIDYAVMEKADKVAVVPMAPDWSDVGSWDSIAELHEEQNEGSDNIVIGQSKTIDSKDNLIWSGDTEVQMIGIDNLIVIVNEGKVVILPRGQSQEVKKLSE